MMLSNMFFDIFRKEKYSFLWFISTFVLLSILAYIEKGPEAAILVPTSLVMIVVFVIVIIDFFTLIAKRNKIENSWAVLIGLSLFYVTIMFFIGKSKIAIFIFFLSLFTSLGLLFIDYLKRN